MFLQHLSSKILNLFSACALTFIQPILSGAAGNTPEFIQGMKGGLPPSGNMV